MSRVNLTNTSWTLLATAPTFIRVQNVSGAGKDLMVAYEASEPGSLDAGEVLWFGAVDVREDLFSQTKNAYARSVGSTGIINVET